MERRPADVEAGDDAEDANWLWLHTPAMVDVAVARLRIGHKSAVRLRRRKRL
jgi:hypothetical protein